MAISAFIQADSSQTVQYPTQDKYCLKTHVYIIVTPAAHYVQIKIKILAYLTVYCNHLCRVLAFFLYNIYLSIFFYFKKRIYL